MGWSPRITLPKQPASQSGMQLLSPLPNRDRLFPRSVSQPQSAIQPLSSSPARPPHPFKQTSFPAPGCDVVTCLPTSSSETVLVLMCLCIEEFTRKQLARGRQLLFPSACSRSGGQQQDAMGEKWLGGPAAALGQSQREGQGQVGSGLCCPCGMLGLGAHSCMD